MVRMRLVSVHTPPRKPIRHRKKRKIIRWLLLLVLVAGVVNYIRPLPNPTVSINLPSTPPPTAAQVNWPSSAYASLYIDGYGLVGSRQGNDIIATASIAKVITALSVLEKKPLKLGETGPAIPITQQDLDLYNAEIAHNGSRLYVQPGEQLTEYEMLQAVLIPSANNIANSLAVWAFGSLDAYRTYATDFAARNELFRTHIGSDASGLDPSTTSTAHDLAKLGRLAMANEVIADIVSQKSANFPYAGTMYNYNTALGNSGINGIKTGNNDANPGGLLYSASANADGQQVALTGAVLNSADLSAAIAASEALVQSAPANFERVVYAQKNQRIGEVSTEWGAAEPVRMSSQLDILRWKDMEIRANASTTKDITLETTELGKVTLKTGEHEVSADIGLDRPLAGPSWWWRLMRH